jgi:tetratricopeptide (TPR) repeat protein
MNKIAKFFIISAAIHGIILIILGMYTIGTWKSEKETYISIFLQDEKPVIKEWMIAPVIKPQMSEKAYKDGIVWYQEAMRRNDVEYLTDDYQYMIANIYDEYLHDYNKALEEYNKLITNFPNSTKTKLAIARMRYIQSYSDFNFQPLKIFEKVKRNFFRMDKKTAINTVQRALKDYPGNSLEDVMLDWLARTCGDTYPEKAVSFYLQLIENHPKSKLADRARIGIGDTFYYHGEYKRAIEEYKSAGNILPQRYHTEINQKIQKSRRNINRVRILRFAYGLIAIAILGAFLLKPHRLSIRDFRISIILLGVYAFISTVAVLFMYQHYQKLVMFLVWLCPSVSVMPAISTMIIKILHNFINKWYIKYANPLLTILLTLATFYIVTYHYNSHYLVVFGL